MRRWRELCVFVCAIALGLVQSETLAARPSADFNVYLPLASSSRPETANVVANGDFEAGRTAWTEYEDSAFFDYALIVDTSELPPPVVPFEGSWAAWLGGDSELVTYIEQEVAVPEVQPQLVYRYWIDSVFPCDESRGGVSLNGALVDQHLICTATDTGGWVTQTVDLAAYAGLTVTLRFESQTGADDFGSLYVDAVSIQSVP